MTVELWGFDGKTLYGLPNQPSGYLVLLFSLAALLALYRSSRKNELWQPHQRRRWHWPLLLVLLTIAPFAAQTFLIRLPLSSGLVTPGISIESNGPAFAIFGAIPWVFAAGFLGIREAMLVGLVGGMARGGWETFHILTPAHMALQAGLVAWLLRRDYREWVGRIARNPIISGITGGVFFGAAQAFERFASSTGSLYDGIDYTLVAFSPIMLAAVIEAGFAGLVGETVRWASGDAWYRPIRYIVGPYNRSLASRLLTILLLLGLLSSAVLLYGDWLSIQSTALEFVEEQMEQTARHASGGIPFFVQAGRAFSRQIAEDIYPTLLDGSLNSETIASHLQMVSFFSQLAVFDTEAQLVATYPPQFMDQNSFSLDVEAGLEAALNGVPGEVLIRSSPTRALKMAFLSPIQASLAEDPIGVVGGWTEPISNVFLSPAISSLEEFTHGNAFITNASGAILMQTEEEREIQSFNLEMYADDQAQIEIAPDGTRRLVYALAVEGYPWHVIITSPLKEVQRQAFQISIRLASVLGVVGAAMAVAVYTVSRRLTQPLRLMSSMAQSIAKGNLAQPVPEVGDDEIGRLASSFEQMRRSLKARLDEMGLLLKVSQQVGASFELSQMLPPILEGAQTIAEADLVRLALEPAIEETFIPSIGYQAGEDPGNWAALDSQVLLLCQERGSFTLENPSRAKAVLDLQALSEPIKALTSLPMRHEGEYVGVLWLGHRQPHVYTPDEFNLLSILAGQLGVAVANARLYHRAERERMRLMAVLEGTPDAVIVIDPDDRISLVNPEASSLLQLDVDDSIGEHVGEKLMIPELADLLLERDHGVQTAELEINPGQVMFASVSSIHPDSYEASGRVCVLWDVTHYKKLDSLKSEFVSTVSHDLRAPLTLMRGYATMIGIVGDMNDQQKDFLRKILGSVDQMGELVDNLLDLGRIEAGMGLSLERIQIQSIIQEVVGAYRPRAVNKQLVLAVNLADGMETIEADPTLLRQAIANLVDNAIKYTPAGGQVSMLVEQRNGQQVISIRDTGYGIAPTDQARLFEKFYRVRHRETMNEKGLGLGLAIVKSIVEQHHGRVNVESKLGAGSTFTLALPMRSPVENKEH